MLLKKFLLILSRTADFDTEKAAPSLPCLYFVKPHANQWCLKHHEEQPGRQSHSEMSEGCNYCYKDFFRPPSWNCHLLEDMWASVAMVAHKILCPNPGNMEDRSRAGLWTKNLRKVWRMSILSLSRPVQRNVFTIVYSHSCHEFSGRLCHPGWGWQYVELLVKQALLLFCKSPSGEAYKEQQCSAARHFCGCFPLNLCNIHCACAACCKKNGCHPQNVGWILI